MATTYPETWVERVRSAPKLTFDASTGDYRVPESNSAIPADEVAERTATYLRSEAARQRHRLTKDDERVCRDYVLILANWPILAQPVKVTPRRVRTTTRSRPH
jgi:hypothetical protein